VSNESHTLSASTERERESRGGSEPLLLRSFREASGAVFQSSPGAPSPSHACRALGLFVVEEERRL